MNKSYRVALELQPALGKRSGIGNYTYELTQKLKSAADLQFVGNVFNFRGQTDLREFKLPVRQCPVMPYGVYRRIWHWLPIRYDRLFPAADLSIFFNYIVPPRISGKVLTVIHDLTWLRYPETLDDRNLRRIERDIKYSLERADRVLTISEFSRKEIIELLAVPAERIRVVSCAAGEMPESVDWDGLSGKYNLSKPYLLYIGNIEPRKNLAALLQAFALLKREQGIAHRLVIAGGGWGQTDFQQVLQNLPCAADVVQVGYVQPAEKRALYENAAAFVFPSLYEGFGIPPLEAMVCGCPVVCASVASLPEVVGAAAELVNPLSAPAVAEGIWRVISDERRAAELRAAGFEQTKKYSWVKSARRLEKICREVLGIS